VPLKSYSETIDWLFQRFPSYQNIGISAYKPGLENVLKLCHAFDNPQYKLQFIHVAGSNGKGSTSSILASFLTENNLKTGLFTSPHLLDFRERIRVDGKMITEKDVILFCQKIKSLSLDFEPSFFEISFVMAIDFFTKSNCAICVIETGLGGRLDATNIIKPILSIITTISLEHTNLLGNTLAAIAFEKAGIIKKNTPAIIGQKNPSTEQIFRQKAQEESSKLHFTKDYNFAIPDNFPLLGIYQKDNYQTVCLAIEEISKYFHLSMDHMDDALKKLTKNTGFQGRLQIVSEHPKVIFDVSHNKEGILASLNFLQNEFGHLKIVYGSSADKNFEDIFPLFSKDNTYFFTEFSNVRSAKKSVLDEFSKKFKLNAEIFSDPKKALLEAKELSTKDDTIVAFGSFFLLHDLLK
jgi:dihydrofolate synthase/folylpolyglutamate synthase